MPLISSRSLPETRALIALSLIPGIASGRMLTLIRELGSAEMVFHVSEKTLMQIAGLGKKTAYAIKHFDRFEEVDVQLDQAARCGVEMICFDDDKYPDYLRNIYDPPAFLWCRGSLLPSDARAVAIVGTRKPTRYGMELAFQMATALVHAGFTVVSGLAYGIDTQAHQAALGAGGRTLAVLGSGADIIYPAENNNLARRIADHGALLSEFAFGTRPDPPNFPRRNRIVSGLAQATLVVEAYAKGGALITARLAAEQNREVFAVPGPVYSEASAGCHLLIQQSVAHLVNNAAEILEELDMARQFESRPDYKGETEHTDKIEELEPIEKKVLSVLEHQPVHIDLLCMRAQLEPANALVILLALEFKGLVRQMAGKHFYRL